jgi:NAD+ diphosphatase
MRFTYCPNCGKKLIYKEIGDEGIVPFCNYCSKPYFDWFGVCVITAVINEFNEVALLRQNYVNTENWVLVAGFIKQGETLEEAVVREVAEETGQKAERVTYITSFYYDMRELLMIGYRCDVKKREFNTSKEVDSIEWHKLPGAMDLLRKGSIAQQLLQTIIRQNDNF